MGVVYFFVVLTSCIIGAVVGLGGGVIIRPLLDAIGYHSIMNIAFLSSVSVLVMAVVSTVKKVQDGTKIDIKTAAMVSVGALVGGMLGNFALEYLVTVFDTEASVQLIQTICTIFFLIVAVYLTAKVKWQYELKNKALFPIIGVFLGAMAVFLGIGGGPINVPVFVILFALPVKQATAFSIVVIFFSHLFRIIAMGFTVGFAYFDLQFLFFIIPAAIIGGILGAVISGKLTDNAVKKAFIATMFLLLSINIYNGITFIMY